MEIVDEINSVQMNEVEQVLHTDDSQKNGEVVVEEQKEVKEDSGDNKDKKSGVVDGSHDGTGEGVEEVDDHFIHSLIQSLESDMFSDSSSGPFGTKSPTKNEVLKEIERLEDEERQHKFLELQRIKLENDRRITGMVENVHNLMESYGLDIPQTPVVNANNNNDDNNNSDNNNISNNEVIAIIQNDTRNENLREIHRDDNILPEKPSRLDSLSPPIDASK